MAACSDEKLAKIEQGWHSEDGYGTIQRLYLLFSCQPSELNLLRL